MAKLRVGETVEVALWYNADKPGEAEAAREGIYKSMLHMEDEYGFRLGPVEFEDLAPGDKRVPEPPEHFAGQPRLKVGFADIVKLTPKVIGSEAGFVADLEDEDRDKLRSLTRRAHREANPLSPIMTDLQVDTVVNEVGPETAMRGLEGGKDTRIIN